MFLYFFIKHTAVMIPKYVEILLYPIPIPVQVQAPVPITVIKTKSHLKHIQWFSCILKTFVNNRVELQRNMYTS